MQNTSYYLKSLRHSFAKCAGAGDGSVGVISGAVLTYAVLLGGTYAVLDKMPDTATTPQTEAVLAAMQNDLSTLEKDYRSLRDLNDRLASGDYSAENFAALQEERKIQNTGFDEKAVPILRRILFNPHLSEKQAERLMTQFENTMKPPETVAPEFGIADYGFLREARAAAIERGDGDPAVIVAEASGEIKRAKEKHLDIVVTLGLPGLVLALLGGVFVGDSRRLKKWAQDKPQKTFKPRH